MTWTQVYSPAGNLLISALIASIPVVVLLGLLGLFHVKAHWAAIAGLVSAVVIAIAVYGMPSSLALAAAANGALYGLFPIGWIVLCAIFVYDITVETGQFEILKQTVAGLAEDRRVQALLIAFSFGAFIEGAAGFGTPVAISGAMLIGLGFKPLHAAGLALIGNTAPVAFGALGTPIIALSSVTGLPLEDLSAMVGRQLPFFSLIVPFWLVWVMAGRKNMIEVWPACLTAGGSFALMQFLFSNFHGPWLVDIAGSLVSMGATLVLLKFWQPKNVWRFDHEEAALAASGAIAHSEIGDEHPEVSQSGGQSVDMGAGSGRSGHVPVSRAAAWRAWTPWIILTVMVFMWGTPQVKGLLDGISDPRISVPFLDQAVFRSQPVVPAPVAEAAVYRLNWVSATGTALLLAGILSGLFLGLGFGRIFRVFFRTVYRVRMSLLTIAAMLALGYASRYAGLDATMGLAIASTGPIFPFFSPLLGWLGVALTGSDTSSNVLFGNLQQVSAQQVGMSPVLAAASNSSGGVMGKMIDAQSIVVAGVATGQEGGEGDILRYVFKHSIVLAMLVGVVVMLQHYFFQWMIPDGISSLEAITALLLR